MAASVIIDDYHKRSRITTLLTETHAEMVTEVWDQPSVSLMQLGAVDKFIGRDTWSKLDPWHFRVLITNALNNLDKHTPPDKRFDMNDIYVHSLYFTIAAYIKMMETRTESSVDVVRIMRLSSVEITIEFTLVVIPEVKMKPKGTFSVVIDNTKK